jgi:hypothetical protein
VAATTRVLDRFAVNDILLRKQMTEILTRSPLTVYLYAPDTDGDGIGGSTTDCVATVEQLTMMLDPSQGQPMKILRRSEEIGKWSKTAFLHDGNVVVQATDRCGELMSSDVVDTLTKQPTNGSLTDRLETSQLWLTTRGERLSQPTPQDKELLLLLKSLVTSSKLSLSARPGGNFLDVTWNTDGRDHTAILGVESQTITSLTSQEFRNGITVTFVDERADLHDAEREMALGAPLVDAEQFLAAQQGKALSVSASASKGERLQLPAASPGKLLPVRDLIFQVEQGKGFNSVKLSLETTGRVVAESEAFPGVPPQPIAWMVGAQTVERLRSLAAEPKYYELPQDSDRTGEWLRVTSATQSAEGVRAADASHEQLYLLGEELISSLIGELTEPARLAPPALIATTFTKCCGDSNSGYGNPILWPLDKPPSAYFDVGRETQCVLFTGAEAEGLWSVLGPQNGVYDIEMYDTAGTGIWSFEFQVAFTAQYLNC